MHERTLGALPRSNNFAVCVPFERTFERVEVELGFRPSRAVALHTRELSHMGLMSFAHVTSFRSETGGSLLESIGSATTHRAPLSVIRAVRNIAVLTV